MSNPADMAAIGWLPAQHHDQNFAWPSTRRLICNKFRVLGKDPITTEYQYQDNTFGYDQGGGVLLASYKNSPVPAALPGLAQMAAGQTMTVGAGNGTTSSSPSGRNTALWVYAVPARLENNPPDTTWQQYQSTVNGPGGKAPGGLPVAYAQLMQDPSSQQWVDDPYSIPTPVALPAGPLPTGTKGIMLALDTIDQQQMAFVPAGGQPLISVWHGGQPEGQLGTPAYDVLASGALDPQRWGRTQSSFRVYRYPSVGTLDRMNLSGGLAGAASATGTGNPPGGWTWELGVDVDGQGGCGAMTDLPSAFGSTITETVPTSTPAGGQGQTTTRQSQTGNASSPPTAAGSSSPTTSTVGGSPPTPPPTRVIALASYRATGIVDCGGPGCPHIQGVTPDGETVYSSHGPETFLWRGPTGDAPNAFDPSPWIPPTMGPLWVQAFYRNNLQAAHRWNGGSAQGLRMWEATTFIGTPTPNRTKPPAGDGPGRTKTPSGDGPSIKLPADDAKDPAVDGTTWTKPPIYETGTTPQPTQPGQSDAALGGGYGPIPVPQPVQGFLIQLPNGQVIGRGGQAPPPPLPPGGGGQAGPGGVPALPGPVPGLGGAAPQGGALGGGTLPGLGGPASSPFGSGEFYGPGNSAAAPGSPKITSSDPGTIGGQLPKPRSNFYGHGNSAAPPGSPKILSSDSSPGLSGLGGLWKPIPVPKGPTELQMVAAIAQQAAGTSLLFGAAPTEVAVPALLARAQTIRDDLQGDMRSAVGGLTQQQTDDYNNTPVAAALTAFAGQSGGSQDLIAPPSGSRYAVGCAATGGFVLGPSDYDMVAAIAGLEQAQVSSALAYLGVGGPVGQSAFSWGTPNEAGLIPNGYTARLTSQTPDYVTLAFFQTNAEGEESETPSLEIACDGSTGSGTVSVFGSPISPSGVSGTSLYGDGSDGSFTLTGGTLSTGPILGPYAGGPGGTQFYAMQRDVNAVNITLASGYSLNGGSLCGTGYAYTLLCTGTLTVPSGAQVNIDGYAGGSGLSGGLGGAAIYSSVGSTDGPGGSAGTNGGTGSSGTGNGANGTSAPNGSACGGGAGGPPSPRGTAGNGGGTSPATGGTGGQPGTVTGLQFAFNTLITYLSGNNSRGVQVLGGTGGASGGGGGCEGSLQTGGHGGGGGGGAPTAALGAKNIVLGGLITCNGGAGGAGSAGTGTGGGGSGAGGGGGGSGGGAGVLLVAYDNLSGSGSFQANGGAAGVGGAAYAAGSAGVAGGVGANGVTVQFNNNA